MNRPVDWSALDLPSDPVPGDPELVQRGGRHYIEVAGAIHEAAVKLRRIADGQAHMVSEAVEAIRDTARAVAEDVSRAFERYDETGQALVGYGPAQDEAQAESLQALMQARQARDDIQDAQRKVAFFAAQIAGAPAGADTSMEEGARRRAEGALDEANADLAAAKRRVYHAMAMRDDAAQRAMARVNEVVQHVDLNDGWYENWGKDFLAVVAKWCGRIGAVLGVLSLFLGWVPFLGWALIGGAVFFSAVGLAATSIQKAHDDASWLDVAVASVGLLAAGAGAVAKVGLRGAAAAARSAATGARATRASEDAYAITRTTMRSWRAGSRFFHQAEPPRGFRAVLTKIGSDLKSGRAFKTAGDEFIGGQSIRGFQYGRSLQAEFKGFRGAEDADEVLRQAKNLQRAGATGFGAHFTGQGLTVYGIEEDITESFSAAEKGAAQQLNLPRASDLPK